MRTNPTYETFINDVVKIYPNPANSELNIEFLEQPETNFEIVLVNQLGTVVKQINSNNKISQRINLGDVPSGIYIILLNDGNKFYSSKLIKI